VDIPRLIPIERHFPDYHLHDLAGAIRAEFHRAGPPIAGGARIAVAVGSRGLANLPLIVRTVVDCVKEAGGRPFIVPAMGSHGGATPEGQLGVLEGYGVTEDFIGAPIESSLAVAELPRGDLPNRVYMDRRAFEADGTIVINRVKPHTDFHGPIESGIMKMCVIGLGKHAQALEIHRFGVYGLRELIGPTARQVLKHGRILLGLGLVEDAHEQTAMVRAVRPAEFEEVEAILLAESRRLMPGLPVDNLDVLIVDEMGKEISGTGLDTNVIGRMRMKFEPEPDRPRITNIVVCDLTDASHGNALGVGLSDFITRRLYEKIDFRATYENVITSTNLERGKLPIVAECDRQAIGYALRTCGPIAPLDAGIIRIKNTLRLSEMLVSRPVLAALAGREDVAITGEERETVDAGGNLSEVW